MSQIKIRKQLLNIETVYHEGGPVAAKPLKLVVIAVVIDNPFAGHFVGAELLAEFVKEGRMLANDMVPELIAALGGKDKIEAYGKGAIVGTNGELEHGAMWHEAGGWAMRAVLDPGKVDCARSQVRGHRRQSPARAAASHRSLLCAQPLQYDRSQRCRRSSP